jgi:hypothetical protein
MVLWRDNILGDFVKLIFIALLFTLSTFASDIPSIGPMGFSGSLNPLVKEDLQTLLLNLQKSRNQKDEARNDLQDLIDHYKETETPLFPFAPHPGTEGKVPNQSEPLDALKGCVSRTKCTGTGDKKECVTWEVCVSN